MHLSFPRPSLGRLEPRAAELRPIIDASLRAQLGAGISADKIVGA
jgi:hypothetical protein